MTSRNAKIAELGNPASSGSFEIAHPPPPEVLYPPFPPPDVVDSSTEPALPANRNPCSRSIRSIESVGQYDVVRARRQAVKIEHDVHFGIANRENTADDVPAGTPRGEHRCAVVQKILSDDAPRASLNVVFPHILHRGGRGRER